MLRLDDLEPITDQTEVIFENQRKVAVKPASDGRSGRFTVFIMSKDGDGLYDVDVHYPSVTRAKVEVVLESVKNL